MFSGPGERTGTQNASRTCQSKERRGEQNRTMVRAEKKRKNEKAVAIDAARFFLSPLAFERVSEAFSFIFLFFSFSSVAPAVEAPLWVLTGRRGQSSSLRCCSCCSPRRSCPRWHASQTAIMIRW